MIRLILITTLLILHCCLHVKLYDIIQPKDDEVRLFLENFNKKDGEQNYDVVMAEWNYVANLTKETLDAKRTVVFIPLGFGWNLHRFIGMVYFNEDEYAGNDIIYVLINLYILSLCKTNSKLVIAYQNEPFVPRNDRGWEAKNGEKPLRRICRKVREINIKVEMEHAKWLKDQQKEFNKYSSYTFKDADLGRQYNMLSFIGTGILPDDKFEKLTQTVGKMQSIYSTAKICSYYDKDKCDLSMQPDLENIISNSEHHSQLKHLWVEWRNASGKKVRQLFKEYVDLSNEAAVLNNMTDYSEFWIYRYEDSNFREEIKKLWEKLQPLYLQIHAYVRYKLRQKYGDKIVSKDGYIPAHLLGNMWSQNWVNIYKHIIPYPEVKSTDVTKELVKQGYTPVKIFKTAEEFFTSINMSGMTDQFWVDSILEKPKDRKIVCHASAWDFYNAKDFRIKQCTEPTQTHFYTAHHEMGHIVYYMSYRNQPFTYKHGANSGFHEAVGDVISLSVSTDKHLHKIGLLKLLVESDQATINKLLEIGLFKIAFLPYAYIMDLWRWDVFKGKITPENYNSAWWKLRHDYQGIEAPVPRSEDDFDIGAKYHTVADVPYIRYFVSFVIQFQFHKALCEKAGQYEPNNPEKALHKCDIYQSKEAGNALQRMLEMGSSKPWQDAMESLTGQRTMDASAFLEYFAPLQEWLIEENKKTGEYIGWK